MNQFDGEMAAIRHQREMESLGESKVSVVLSRIGDVGSEFGVPGAGLFAKALKGGQTPVEKVVEQIENGAYKEIARIWMHLEGQDVRQREFESRLQSQEAHGAYLSAILHGLRTSDPKKQVRLGTLTINCIHANETEPETLDDVMRAAVELKDVDILFLGGICRNWGPKTSADGDAPFDTPFMFEKMFEIWQQLESSQRKSESVCRGSLARLQAHGLLYSYYGGGYGSSTQYDLLDEGKKFFERVQEIVDE